MLTDRQTADKTNGQKNCEGGAVKVDGSVVLIGRFLYIKLERKGERLAGDQRFKTRREKLKIMLKFDGRRIAHSPNCQAAPRKPPKVKVLYP
jgi:hypothetical protein